MAFPLFQKLVGTLPGCQQRAVIPIKQPGFRKECGAARLHQLSFAHEQIALRRADKITSHGYRHRIPSMSRFSILIARKHASRINQRGDNAAVGTSCAVQMLGAKRYTELAEPWLPNRKLEAHHGFKTGWVTGR